MTTEEYQWQLKIVKDRLEYLDLTYEQAEKIFKYEQDRDTYSGSHIFSVWEEFDYEDSAFREILGEEQFILYGIAKKESIKRLEQDLIEHDNNLGKEISYYTELSDFYETKFLPDFFRDPLLIHLRPISGDYTKLVYIKAEYKKFLNDSKKKILVNHFRFNRIFKPNELKLSLMQHKLYCMFPDFALFKADADEPTRVILDYLVVKFRNIPERTSAFLSGKFKELREFNHACFKKHFGEVSGWHTELRSPTNEEEREDQLMRLMLLDKDRYGF